MVEIIIVFLKTAQRSHSVDEGLVFFSLKMKFRHVLSRPKVIENVVS